MADFNDLSVPDKVAFLLKQAKEAHERSEHQMAHAFYTQSLNLARGLDDKPSIIRCLIGLGYLVGWVASAHPGFVDRVPLGEEALRLSREIGDRKGESGSLRLLSTVSGPEGIRMAEEALAIAEELNDVQEIAAGKDRLAALYGLRDQARAFRLAEEAIALLRTNGITKNLASYLFSAAIYTMRDADPSKPDADPTKHRAYLEEAATLYREHGDRKGLARCLFMLGDSYPKDDPRAEACYLETLTIERQFGNPGGIANCLNRLAGIARQLGDIAQAETLEAESKATYTFPEPDPEFMKALEAGDSEAATKAFVKMH
jgi:tetratricopeptide (TPR) repeat protein